MGKEQPVYHKHGVIIQLEPEEWSFGDAMLDSVRDTLGAGEELILPVAGQAYSQFKLKIRYTGQDGVERATRLPFVHEGGLYPVTTLENWRRFQVNAVLLCSEDRIGRYCTTCDWWEWWTEDVPHGAMWLPQKHRGPCSQLPGPEQAKLEALSCACIDMDEAGRYLREKLMDAEARAKP